MLIEEIPSTEPPRGKVLIAEMDQSQNPAQSTSQLDASLLVNSEPDDQSHPLTEGRGQSKVKPNPLILEVDQSETASPKTDQSQGSVTSAEGRRSASLIEELKQFGARIPSSWHVLENQNTTEEQEKADKPEGEYT